MGTTLAKLGQSCIIFVKDAKNKQKIGLFVYKTEKVNKQVKTVNKSQLFVYKTEKGYWLWTEVNLEQ